MISTDVPRPRSCRCSRRPDDKLAAVVRVPVEEENGTSDSSVEGVTPPADTSTGSATSPSDDVDDASPPTTDSSDAGGEDDTE